MGVHAAVDGQIRESAVGEGLVEEITECRAALLEANSDLGEANAVLMLNPDCLGRTGYYDFELSNNNANIRRMKARLEWLSGDEATKPTTIRGVDGVLYEDCPADNRVRLLFSRIPDVTVRTRLSRRA